MKTAIIVFDEVFSQLNSFFEERAYSKIFFFTDSNTHDLCFPIVLSELKTVWNQEEMEIPPGEDSKVIELVVEIWKTLSELDADRNSLMVNLGGGVITDMGGFIASTFKRKIDFINIPTSLLAMVDAAIGGKTGIDLNGVKNLVGTFAEPQMTFIYPEFLQTLPKRDLISGLAEMLKHGLIQDKTHWNHLIQIENPDASNLQPFIRDSINIKKNIVENDPFENGRRKILNFGHTIGHAVESEFMKTENHLLHGEAIAIGMLVESILSFENELISKEELDEIFTNLLRIFGKTPIDESIIPNLLVWMKHDKKNLTENISFSLLDSIGNCKEAIFQNEHQITEAIKIYNRKLQNF